MAENSAISWTHHTFNPWRGCVKISPGCQHCYAEKMSHRNPGVLGKWGLNANRVPAAESYWFKPLRWDKAAREAGERHRVFCASLADVFEDRDDLIPLRLRLLALIALTPSLDWLLLTKRPHVMAWTFSDPNLYQQVLEAAIPWRQRRPELTGIGISDPTRGWSNLWAGTSVEDQQRADERIPHLLKVPARVRFLSMEPLLGPVNLTAIHEDARFRGRINNINALTGFHGQWGGGFTGPAIDWVIVGGESGHQARPMDVAWASRIVKDCRDAGVSVFVKQMGSVWAKANGCDDKKGGDPASWPVGLRVREMPQ